MILIKCLQAVIVVTTLCLANISGIVTDTGTTPIVGAVVQLEKDGQTATTGTDGSFTLATTAILPVNSNFLPNSLIAGISGNNLNIIIAKQSALEIRVFNLTGKVLSTVRKTLGAGNHSIPLSDNGPSIYLYKVKTGNNEIVLKSIKVGRIPDGSGVISQVSSSHFPAKQTKATATINDVITATKTGYLNYRCVQYNSDTSGIRIKLIASAGTITDADGNVYQSVRIGNQVWMTENLRVTKYNNGSAILLDTSKATWSNATTPEYCFYNNMTDADSIKKYGALYNWNVVNPSNPQKIAPAGWHVPSKAEWDTLQNYLIANGYNWDGTITGNNIAKSLAAKTDWSIGANIGTIGYDLTNNNHSGFSALPGGCRGFDGDFHSQSISGIWWSTTEYGVSGWCSDLNFGVVSFGRGDRDSRCGISVRLVRD